MNSQTLNNIKQRFEDEFWSHLTNNGDFPYATDELWNFIQEEIQKAEREAVKELQKEIWLREALYQESVTSIIANKVIEQYLSQPTGDKK